MAITDYQKALKIGLKTKRTGKNSLLMKLEDRIADEPPMSQQRLGLIEIPIELIVGTYSSGRTNAFASDFMPLLSADTEFATKWSELYDSLTESGQRDPVVAYEYLNRYYIVEGNKRVSVQKYMDAVSVEGIVTRLIPQKSDEPEILINYEYLEFYKKTKVNYILMSRQGNYERLYRHIHPSGNDPLTDDEMLDLKYVYSCFRKSYIEKGGLKKFKAKIGDQLLAYIDIYGYENICEQSSAEIRENLVKIWNEFTMFEKEQPLQMVDEPEDQKKSIAHSIAHILTSNVTSQVLKVAFVHFKSPEESGWTRRHDHESKKVQESLGDRIETCSVVTHDSSDYSVLEDLIAKGYKLIFTTTPVLSSISLRCAIEHPEITICNCSLNNAYRHLRSYYLRVYEAKFVIGAIAGIMSENNKIGYIADYPIYGSPAAINAFALGVRLTNPRAKVYLEWSSLKGEDPLERLKKKDVDIVSFPDLTGRNSDNDTGLCGLIKDAKPIQFAVPKWNWSVVYESLIRSVLDGEWKNEDTTHNGQALNYYWGMSANAIDIETFEITEGPGQLVYIIKQMVKKGLMNPFSCEIKDQNHQIVNENENRMSTSEIINIDWFMDIVDGKIPDISEFTESSHELISQLGVKLRYNQS
ncbi:BMP family ABC transporter substrate-binding protein [Ruminococcus sp. HUN007]|uniref:BMP family ABC transporter substrate-binding protein n=1 Tax=Ruminococcus sp. HUN007 TaxID=1514668 RepID=UPI0005D2B444|nr:BMP family ABC transporter substrate-binding protein [Ruminococcus sp. HUN007]